VNKKELLKKLNKALTEDKSLRQISEKFSRVDWETRAGRGGVGMPAKRKDPSGVISQGMASGNFSAWGRELADRLTNTASTDLQNIDLPGDYVRGERDSIRLNLNLGEEWKEKPKDEKEAEIKRIGVQIQKSINDWRSPRREGRKRYPVRAQGGASAIKLTPGVSGAYMAFPVEVTRPGVDGGVEEIWITLNPGFRITGDGGQAGPGEGELVEWGESIADLGGVTLEIPGATFTDIVGVSKPGGHVAGGEPKSDVDILEKNGTAIRLSLKGDQWPTWGGAGQQRAAAIDNVEVEAPEDIIDENSFRHYVRNSNKKLIIYALEQWPTNWVADEAKKTLTLEWPGSSDVRSYSMPADLQKIVIYGNELTVGPLPGGYTSKGSHVDYVVSARKGRNRINKIKDKEYKAETMEVKGAYPDVSFAGDDAPVLGYRREGTKSLAVEDNQLFGDWKIKIKGVRTSTFPAGQRTWRGELTTDAPSEAAAKAAIERVTGGGDSSSPSGPEIVPNPSDPANTKESTLIDLYQSLLNEASSLGLLNEELTRADKKEIKNIARKEAIKEIERVVGNDFSKTIQEEIKKSLGQKATKQEVAEISKQVLKKLYKEMSQSYNPLIDRIKI